MGKKRNKRGLGLPNVQAHREKLKLAYRARGRASLPKYLFQHLVLDPILKESSFGKGSSSSSANPPTELIEPMKTITSGRNLQSELLKGSRWIVDLPYRFENYEKLVLGHM